MSTETSKIVFLSQTGSQEFVDPVEQTTKQSTYNHCICAEAEPLEMETMEELIPFAKEILSRRPSRGLLKVYLVGSVFAVLGTVIGLVETVCHPFLSGEDTDADAEMVLMLGQRTVEAQGSLGKQEEELAHENEATTQTLTLSKTHGFSQRSTANRLHAS